MLSLLSGCNSTSRRGAVGFGAVGVSFELVARLLFDDIKVFLHGLGLNHHLVVNTAVTLGVSSQKNPQSDGEFLL